MSSQQTRNQHGMQEILSRGGPFINGRKESPLYPLVAPSPYTPTPVSQFKEVLAQRRQLLSKHRDEKLRSTDTHFQSNPIARMETLGQYTNLTHSVNNSAAPQEYSNSGFLSLYTLNNTNKNYYSGFQNNQAPSRNLMVYSSNDQEHIYQSSDIPQRANTVPVIMRGRQQFRPHEQQEYSSSSSRMMSAIPPKATQRMIQQNYSSNLNGNVQSYHSATSFVNGRGMQTDKWKK
jgi:hypothetical protein